MLEYMGRANRHMSFADLLGGHPACLAKVVNPHQSLVSTTMGLGLPVSHLYQAGIGTRETVLSDLM